MTLMIPQCCLSQREKFVVHKILAASKVPVLDFD